MPASGKSSTKARARARKASQVAVSVPHLRSRPAVPMQVSDERFAPQTWGKAPNAAIIELDVPSGQTCLVRTVGVQGLMEAGILNNLDGLTALVDKKYLKPREDGGVEINAPELAKDKQATDAVFETVKKVVCLVVVEPKVEPVPMIQDSEGHWVEDMDPASRIPGVVYIDTVPEVDQMYIFSAVTGGPRSLEQFRQQSEDALGGLDIGEAVEDASE